MLVEWVILLSISSLKEFLLSIEQEPEDQEGEANAEGASQKPDKKFSFALRVISLDAPEWDWESDACHEVSFEASSQDWVPEEFSLDHCDDISKEGRASRCDHALAEKDKDDEQDDQEEDQQEG